MLLNIATCTVAGVILRGDAEATDSGFYIGANTGFGWNKYFAYSFENLTSPENLKTFKEYFASKEEQGIASEQDIEFKKNIEDIESKVKVPIPKFVGIKYVCKNSGILAEGVLGYEHKFDSGIIGINFIFGNLFGRSKSKAEIRDATMSVNIDNNDAEVNIKPQFHVGAMPRIGFRVTSEATIYLTGGIQYIKHCATSIDHESIQKERRGKINPVIGCGLKLDCSKHSFTNLEYNYLFKSKLDDFKYRGHVIKVGVGYVF